MNNYKKDIDILKLFGVVSINDVIDFLERPIEHDKIYSKPIPIEHYSKTNLSLAEFLVSHSQFCIEPEDPFSLELRLFKGDQVILDNNKIFIKRSNVCREFIEKNISSISFSFFNFLQEDLNKNLIHKKSIKKLLSQNELKKFTIDKKQVIQLFNKGLNFKPNQKNLVDLYSVSSFNPLENKKNFSIKLFKCLLFLIDHKKNQVFDEKFKSPINSFNQLHLNSIQSQDSSFFEINSLEFLKHTASVFPINHSEFKNKEYVFQRNYSALDLIEYIELKDLQTFFLQYFSLRSIDLLPLDFIEKMMKLDDLIQMIDLFLQKQYCPEE